MFFVRKDRIKRLMIDSDFCSCNFVKSDFNSFDDKCECVSKDEFKQSLSVSSYHEKTARLVKTIENEDRGGESFV